MRDLIERLEKAAAPDRELDADILCAVEPRWFRSPAATAPWCHDGQGGACAALPYTSSLDAALALVPEGWAANLYTENRQAELYRTKRALRRGIVVRVSDRPSVAIALTIAALKARMADERDLTQEASNG